MFDLGWQEFLLVALVAVIVVGPKDLPRVVRTVGQWVRKARSLASEFQGNLEEMAREADLDDVRKQVQSVSKEGLGKTIEKHVDPDGAIRGSIDDARKSADADAVGRELRDAHRSLRSAADPGPGRDPAGEDEVEAPAVAAPDDKATAAQTRADIVAKMQEAREKAEVDAALAAAQAGAANKTSPAGDPAGQAEPASLTGTQAAASKKPARRPAKAPTQSGTTKPSAAGTGDARPSPAKAGSKRSTTAGTTKSDGAKTAKAKPGGRRGSSGKTARSKSATTGRAAGEG